jgi:hypothetical protein
LGLPAFSCKIKFIRLLIFKRNGANCFQTMLLIDQFAVQPPCMINSFTTF